MSLRQEPSSLYKLKTLSKQLRKLSVSVKLATFAADALDKYLSGKCSLESAFGLGEKPGVSGRPKARVKLAKAVYALRKAGHSWTSALDELSEQGFGDLDLGTVKRTYKEFWVRFVARDIAQTIDQDADLFSPTKIRKTKTRE